MWIKDAYLAVFSCAPLRKRGEKARLCNETLEWSRWSCIDHFLFKCLIATITVNLYEHVHYEAFWSEMHSPYKVCGRNTLTSRLFVFLLVMWLSCYRAEAHPVRQTEKNLVVEKNKKGVLLWRYYYRSASTHLINNGMLLKHCNCRSRLHA